MSTPNTTIPGVIPNNDWVVIIVELPPEIENSIVVFAGRTELYEGSYPIVLHGLKSIQSLKLKLPSLLEIYVGILSYQEESVAE